MAAPVPDFNPRARHRQHAKIDAVRSAVSSRTPQFPRDAILASGRTARSGRGDATTRASHVLASLPSPRDTPNPDADRPLEGPSVPPLAPSPD